MDFLKAHDMAHKGSKLDLLCDVYDGSSSFK